jgi:signal peptidase I
MRAIAVCTSLVFCFLSIGCEHFRYSEVEGAGMEPNISDGDGIWLVRVGESSEIDRFDIVWVDIPENSPQTYPSMRKVVFSRVVGLPNEKVEIKEGKVFINDTLLEEPFETIKHRDGISNNESAIVIPANEYYLLCDNREDGFDSRWMKPATIKRELISRKLQDIKRGYFKGN